MSMNFTKDIIQSINYNAFVTMITIKLSAKPHTRQIQAEWGFESSIISALIKILWYYTL